MYIAVILIGAVMEAGKPILDSGKTVQVRIRAGSKSLALSRARQIALAKGGILIVFQDRVMCDYITTVKPVMEAGKVVFRLGSLEDDKPLWPRNRKF